MVAFNTVLSASVTLFLASLQVAAQFSSPFTSDIPSACKAECTNVVNTMQSCTASAATEVLKCVCNDKNTQAIAKCFSCAVGLKDSGVNQQTAQTSVNLNLVVGGRYGGQEAAKILSQEIIHYLNTNFGTKPYQLWVKIFLNKRGLIEAYKRFGNVNENIIENKFDELMLGFNQAAERFSIVDVGAIKEAADAKIKAHLEDDLRTPQTEKVIFGGCHDTGYVNSLRSHITSQFSYELIDFNMLYNIHIFIISLAAITALGSPAVELANDATNTANEASKSYD